MLKTVQYFREIPYMEKYFNFIINFLIYFLWFTNIKGRMPKNNRNYFFIQVWSKFHVNFIYLKKETASNWWRIMSHRAIFV